MARDGVAGVGVAVESHTTAAGRVVHLDLAGAWGGSHSTDPRR